MADGPGEQDHGADALNPCDLEKTPWRWFHHPGTYNSYESYDLTRWGITFGRMFKQDTGWTFWFAGRDHRLTDEEARLWREDPETMMMERLL